MTAVRTSWHVGICAATRQAARLSSAPRVASAGATVAAAAFDADLVWTILNGCGAGGIERYGRDCLAARIKV